MLERYFIKPETLDRIRGSWLGEPIESYVTWLTEQGYAARNVHRRMPMLMRFAEFARNHGASSWECIAARHGDCRLTQTLTLIDRNVASIS